MASAPANPDADDPADLPFETAVQRLEQIVERMEAGDVALAELLERYEQGSRLLAVCEARLKSAELKIEQLKRRKDGGMAPEPFAVGETPAP